MTEKQEKILHAALELFAQQGYAATPTSKIARKAGVSEGLIFRHFESKEGLLEAILDYGQENAAGIYANILDVGDPKKTIKAALDLPFRIDKSQYHFWRLIYSLKWQMDTYDYSMSAPVKKALVDAFKQLDFKHPEAEAELVMAMIDGMATAILLRKPDNSDEIRQALLAKYDF
jgi:AcrR family transcriptional regulator